MTQARPSAIDAWCNLALPGTLPASREIERLFAQSGMKHVLDRGIELEEMVEMMDRAGVQRALITLWHRDGVWQDSDGRVGKAVRRFPERFVGVAAVNLHDPLGAVDDLRRSVQEWGFKALRLVPWMWGLPPNDPLYFPLYAACVELDVPVCWQVGHTGPLAPSEPGRPIPYLDEVAIAFPELRIVGGHLGYPWVDEMIAMARTHPNVYLDTSAHLAKYFPPALVEFMRGEGQNKVLFATNFPMLSFERCVASAAAIGLPEDALVSFLWGNAARVYKLDQSLRE